MKELLTKRKQEFSFNDKASRLTEILATKGCDPRRVVYLGNDINDLGCFSIVGHPVAVSDAHPLVQKAAGHVLTHNGGDGAVRELCDWLLAARAGRR